MYASFLFFKRTRWQFPLNSPKLPHNLHYVHTWAKQGQKEQPPCPAKWTFAAAGQTNAHSKSGLPKKESREVSF